ncbi:MAG: hypothetical protein JW762_16245, partial [Dehalococcoidales bacterium]|nr:hypothetical protein [Dehalococcoidales bacterium]
MKKKLVMIVTSLILLIASLSTMGIAHANQNKTPDTRYYFGDWEPGNTYHAQITQYQRYGPLKNEIESKSDLLYGPESSVKDITIVIDDNGYSGAAEPQFRWGVSQCSSPAEPPFRS